MDSHIADMVAEQVRSLAPELQRRVQRSTGPLRAGGGPRIPELNSRHLGTQVRLASERAKPCNAPPGGLWTSEPTIAAGSGL